MKKLILGIATLTAIGLLAGNVSAGQLNAGNTLLAAELISPTVDSQINAVNTAYQSDGPIAISTQLKITLTKANFAAGTAISLCDPTGKQMATGAIGVAGPEVTLSPLSSPLASGTVYNFQPAAVCVPNGLPLNNILIAKGTPAGTSESPSTASMKVDSVTSPGDATVFASATIVTVINQFEAVVTPVTTKLDFPKMIDFIVDGVATPPNTPASGVTNAALKITSNESIPVGQKVNVAYGGGDCGPLAGNSYLKVKISGSLEGLSNLNYNGIAPTEPVFTAAEKTAQAATRTFVGGNIKVCKVAKVFPLGLTNPAKEQIISGVRNVELTIGASAAGGPVDMPNQYSRTLVQGTKGYEIKLDSSLAYVPAITSNPNARVTCLVNNMGTLNAAVSADIVSSETGYKKEGIALGTAKAGYASRITFEGNTIKGIDGSATTIELPDKTKYSVRFNVNAPMQSLTFFCSQVDPVSGGQKPIPVMTDNSGTGFMW